MDDREARDRVARIEYLLGRIESLADPAARTTATETVRLLLELYGEGLRRIVTHVGSAGGPTSETVLGTLVADELVSHLLLLHGLHPVDIETRVATALDEVRPYLESHGGSVTLLRVEDGVAHLRLQGSCNGCPSSSVTLRLAIEEAVRAAAPELDGIEAEGAVAPPPRAPAGFVPRSALTMKG